MLDQLKIINLALAKLSDYNTVQSLDEPSVEAMQAKAHWDVALHGVLTDHPWDFARRQKRLTLLSEDTTTSAYAYHYAYPADCIVVRRVYSAREPYGNTPFSIAISQDEKQRVIQSNQVEAVAEYTLANTPVSAFPPLFASALAWRIAAEIAMATGKSGAVNPIQGYATTLDQARLSDSREVGPRSRVEGNWLKARMPVMMQSAPAQDSQGGQ